MMTPLDDPRTRLFPESFLMPTSLAMMRHGYSLAQLRILAAVTTAMQPVMIRLLNRSRLVKRPPFLPEEIDSEGRYVLRLPLRKTGVPANHYSRLWKNMEQMSAMPVELPVREGNDRRLLMLPSLFSVERPADQLFHHYAVIRFNASVAHHICSLAMGYCRLSGKALTAMRSLYTARMYIYVASRADRSNVVLTTAALRDLLGIGSKYRRHFEMMKRVVYRSQKELEQLYESGLVHHMFIAVPMSESGQPSGEGGTVMLQIVNRHRDSTIIDDSRQQQIVYLLTRYFRFNHREAAGMAARVRNCDYQNVIAKIGELYNRMRNSRAISNPTAYVRQSLRQFTTAP